MRRIKIIFVFVLLTLTKLSFSQIYPVQLSAQLIPPYSGYLPDYADPSSEKLKVILQFNDLTTPQYNIRLRIEIKGNGFTLVTKQLFNPPPLTLQTGVPLLLSGADLAPYLNSNNLDFIGINQAQYEQRMALPEGYYSICVKAYDYYNPGNIQVSNEFCSQAWFMLSDPPFLNLPQCGKNIIPQNPQNILFQWTPMHMSSPNSAANTEYEFALWEVRPDSSANPNQVVLSTAPIFSTTTNLTLFNYGIAEPPLNLYMKYVWRVRAKDITGRDWFKNTGCSQICTFVYGNLQTVLGNALNLSLSAEGVTHRLGRCSWNTQSIYTKYLLQVRKAGTQNWFDYYCTSGFEKVNNLEPNTSYEARVRGEGSMTGDWSNIATFNTTSEPVYGCNDQTQYADVLAAQPLPVTRAIAGLIIQTGQFEVIATQIYPNGPPGWYSGKGYAKVFGALPLQVEFNNIYIDDNNRHQQGVIQAVTQGIDNWLHQWDVKDAEQNAVAFSGTVDSVYVNGNQLCVKIQGKIGDSCFAFPPNQNVIVVRDDDGNQWTVTVNPPPPTVSGPINYLQYSSDELDAGDSTLVVFQESPQQQYGFDEKKYTAWTTNYELIKLRNGKNYFVPYKSVKEFSNDEVYAEIDIKGFDAGKLSFKADNGFQLTASAVNNTTYKITVPYQYKSVYAWYDGKKVGKLNVVSLKTIAKKLVIVPVGNANISTSNLQVELNKIFQQANVSWNVSVKSAFTYNLGSDGLEAADATLMSKYSTEMRALRDAYKQANADYDKEAYYVFVVSNFSNPELKGYMVRGRALGFVSGSATSKEIAHELAHGAFGLEHTFPSIAKNTSENLMDYGTGTELSKVQWEEMQSSSPIFNWFDEEEDASMSTEDFEKWLKALFGIQCIDTYKNYDGVIPQCVWNNNLNMTTVDAYARALVCGILDGVFLTVKDAISIARIIDCHSPSGYLTSSPGCVEVRVKTAETVKTIKEICTQPGAHKKIYDALINSGVEWELKTFCSDVTCAYSQGRLVFDIVSVFIGVGEVKAALNTGIAGAKIVEIIKALDNAVATLIKAVCKTKTLAKKTAAGLMLSIKLSTGYDFDYGSIDVVKKAIKFNNIELQSTINGTSLGRIDGVNYIENGVVRKGDLELIEFVNPVNNQKAVGWRKVVRVIYKNVTFEDFKKTVPDFSGGAKNEIAETAYRLWGEDKWRELYDLFNPINGSKINDGFPPFNGAKKISKTESGSQLKFKEFDRFQGPGSISGEFASPVYPGENMSNLFFTYDSRALSSSIKEGTNYLRFKFKDNIPNDVIFEYGEVIPWFGKQGLGDQIKSSKKFYDIKDYIEVVEQMEYRSGQWVKIK